MAVSLESFAGSRSRHSSATYTMQVAHEQAPPQSASMPTTPLRTAPSMIDWPSARSSARSVPSGSSNTILVIRIPF